MLSFIESEDSLLFKFDPRLDSINIQQIENDLNAKISESTKTIIFDLDGVVFVSSYFLRICMHTFKTVGTDRFILQNIKSDIKKVFMIAGYDKYLNIQ